jgi:hypothetical protein
MSGYSEEGVPASGTALLAKPFTPEQLLQAVADVLRPGSFPSRSEAAGPADTGTVVA